MTPVPQQELDKIIRALKERGADKPCPRCGNEEFTLVDAFFRQPLQDSLKGLVLGGPSIACAIVICQNCGFMSQHALGYLELLNDVDNLKKD